MMIDIETKDGPRKVRVCDHCKTVCIPHGRFCSARCYQQNRDAMSIPEWMEDSVSEEQKRNKAMERGDYLRDRAKDERAEAD